MNVLKLNGIKVYNLTSNSSLPEWASKSEKKRIKSSNNDPSRHIELIQELEMPDSTTYLTTTPDNRYLFALGRYKPRIKCYELSNLSIKFDRCVDYLPSKMVSLSNDYSKFALLEDERWIDVHAAGGHHFKFRIPRQGVDIAYCPFTCDLYITSSRSSVYRMNLSEGRFKTPIICSRLENSHGNLTCSAYQNEYNLFLAGSTLGCVDGWDTRTSDHVFGLNVRNYAPLPEDKQNRNTFGNISCITYKDSLNVAVGTNDGMVYIYDLRQNRTPWHVRDTEFREPVKTINFHEDKVLALLPYCCKIWNIDSGKIFVGFNTGQAECNWMHHFANSGLLMVAAECPKVSTYFIPLLGEAPLWCSRLDNLVVECEPDVTTMYDGYKFITRQKLNELGMSDLIGTQFLRAYMHGYFISNRLYNKIHEKLQILVDKTLPNSESDYTNVKTDSSDQVDVIMKEFQEASSDRRFSKLSHSDKLFINQSSEDSDLIKIHQSRLEKKRRRKEQQKERAHRSQNLINSVKS